MKGLQLKKARFEAKIKQPNANGCMLWTAGRDTRGYGQFRLDGKQMGAHRVAWLLYRGEIPKGLHVLHKCDVTSCVNPDHLFLGTAQDNVSDMVAKGRAVKKGGRISSKKLSVFHVEFVSWWRNASAESKRRLAREAGTSYVHLSNLTHVEGKTIGPELAGRIESALAGELSRGELCETCRRCPYYQKGEIG